MMNDEIKEKMTIGKAKKILRGFLAKDCYYDTPLYYAIPYLLDYITNLQQENQELNDSITWWNNRFNAIQRDYEDYKSRIEKAVEYLKLKEDSLFMSFSDDLLDHDELIDKKIGMTLLNILNGRSDENE